MVISEIVVNVTQIFGDSSIIYSSSKNPKILRRCYENLK